MDQAVVDIREAAAGDTEALARLHGDAWRYAYRGIIPGLTLERMIARRSAGWWQGAVSRPGAGILKLTFGDTIAGYVNMGAARRRVSGCQGEIYEIYLAPEYQGLGLGARLFRTARANLAAAGRAGLVVWALNENDTACAFYRALGGTRSAQGLERLGGRALKTIAFSWT